MRGLAKKDTTRFTTGYDHIGGISHEDKIRFKGKDVERVFQMENLLDNVQRSDYGYSKEIDYEILFVIAPQFEGQLLTPKRGHKKRLFFTYQGLIKVITNSRSGTANHFMNWMKRIVFKAHLGTDEDKAALGRHQSYPVQMYGQKVEFSQEFTCQEVKWQAITHQLLCITVTTPTWLMTSNSSSRTCSEVYAQSKVSSPNTTYLMINILSSRY